MSLDTISTYNDLDVPRPTSKAVVTRETSEDAAKHNPSFIFTIGKRGIIGLPGGGIEGNEDDVKALIREIWWELSVILDEGKIPKPFLRHTGEIAEGQQADAVVRDLTIESDIPLHCRDGETEVLELTLDQLTDPRERYLQSMGAMALFALNKWLDLQDYTSDSRN